MPAPILQVQGLKTQFFTDDGVVRAVDGITYDLFPGETLGIVGESGCGKSVSALSILGLVQRPGRIVEGQILFHGDDLVKMSPEEVREIRGRDIAMIFQDPLSSLNPVLRIGFQVDEAMKAHQKIPANVVPQRTLELLTQVRIPAADARIKDYPHQFSGGMRQRVMIAMGLANQPEILIADEPTTALDVTVQAQILELLRDLNRELQTAIILITHNLGVVAGLCERVIVMYAGKIVEEGPVEQIFNNPQHPYTWSLLRSIPRIDDVRHERLRSIEGLPPDLIKPPSGCRFHPRCPFRVEECFVVEPVLDQVAPNHRAACHVTMTRAIEEMGAATIVDTSPGAASGVHPPGWKPPDEVAAASAREAAEVARAAAAAGQAPSGTNPRALAALILGVLSFVALPLVAGIAAIAVGSNARRRIAQSERAIKGEALARAGVWLGWINVALSIAVLGFVFFARSPAIRG